MPRQKVKLEKILDKASQQVTLSKRRKGLIKKAMELSVMCDAQVAVIVFSAANKNTSCGYPGSVDKVIANWNAHPENHNPAQENLPVNDEDVDVQEQYELLKKQYAEEELQVRQLEGKDLGNLSIEELNRIEATMLNSLNLLKAKQEEQCLQLQTKLQVQMEKQTAYDQQRMNSDSVHATPVEKQTAYDQQRMNSDSVRATPVEKQIVYDQQTMNSDSVRSTTVYPEDIPDDLLTLRLAPGQLE